MGKLYDAENSMESEIRSEIELRMGDESYEDMSLEETIDSISLYDDQWMEDMIDGYIPVYTADALEMCLENLYLATEANDSGADDPIGIITWNIYEYLRDKAYDIFETIRAEAN